MRSISFVTSLLLVFGMVFLPTPSKADFSIVVSISPPALPVYVQPQAPAPNYIWAPGYWAYDSFFADYYWVPGTWVVAPTPGYLWTPGYWYWNSGQYVYSDGYWGEHIGFYGGINYGHGYGGNGFSGGGWSNGTFVNRTVNETNITNVTNITNNMTSVNGGPGGINAKPTFAEQAAMSERHIPATAQQNKQVQAARNNPTLRASANHGHPAIAATARPGVFKGRGVVSARQTGAAYSKTKRPVKSRAPRSNQRMSHVQTKAKVKKHIVKKNKPKTPPPDVVNKANGGSGN